MLSKTADMLYCNEEKRLFCPQYENSLNKDIGSSDKNRVTKKKSCKDGFFFSSKLAHCYDSVPQLAILCVK